MCYSAQLKAEHRRYEELFGVRISIFDYVKLFKDRILGLDAVIPRGVEAQFFNPQTEAEREIKSAIEQYREMRALDLQREIFEQKTRAAEAERKLQVKYTKTAEQSLGVAQRKIAANMAKLAELHRDEVIESDWRIYPGNYAPLMVRENGELIVKPMRFRCRPAGKPADYDTKYPGTYNARRDSLEGFWKGHFGRHHGVLIVTSFFENVKRHRLEGRALQPGEKEQSTVIEFQPKTGQEMLLACIWSHWTKDGEPDLDSFALITDEPPPEVAAAGHDRCPIPLKRENVEAWLNPNPADLQASYALLDDRERPYYEHKLAA
jgi:putative SOS response-associated peptidase YedK